MKEFMDNLEEVYKISENSPGFVWRYIPDEGAKNPFEDDKVIFTISVW